MHLQFRFSTLFVSDADYILNNSLVDSVFFSAESWIGIFTIASCWPIVEVFTDDEPQNPVSLTTRFFDLTPGIANMSVFDPPEICKNQTVHPEPEFEPELEFDPPITYQYFNVTIDDDKDSGPVNSFFKKGWNYFKSLF